MKNLFKILLLSLLIFSCDKSPTENNSPYINPIVGVWEMSQSKYITDTSPPQEIILLSDENFNQIIVFNSDGTFSYEGENPSGDFNGNGTWSTNSGKLTTITEDETDISDYLITGNTLLFTSTNVNDEGITSTTEVTYIKS